MGTTPEPTDGEDTEAGGSDEKTINDPLTRGDVEAPRADFEGRTPESE